MKPTAQAKHALFVTMQHLQIGAIKPSLIDYFLTTNP